MEFFLVILLLCFLIIGPKISVKRYPSDSLFFNLLNFDNSEKVEAKQHSQNFSGLGEFCTSSSSNSYFLISILSSNKLLYPFFESLV